MALDKWIAVIFLMISIIYGYASFNYPLLPFERNMSFLPNTMPIGLSGLGVLMAMVLIFAPKPKSDDDDDVLGSIDLAKIREYKIGQALMLCGAMVLYALALRPLGFIPMTMCFLVGSGWILGERNLKLMIPIAGAASFFIWYLVQEALGIFLQPLPVFLDG